MPPFSHRAEVEEGWNAYVNAQPYSQDASPFWQRGYVSAELLGSKNLLKPYQNDWLEAREEDTRRISEMGSEMKDMRLKLQAAHRQNISVVTICVLAVITYASLQYFT